MRIGTVGLGRLGALGDDCPDGFFLDPNGAVCLPITEAAAGNLDPYGNPYDLGGPVLAPAGTVGIDIPRTTATLPISLPPIFMPTGVTNPPPGALQTGNMACPAGYRASGGVCIPVAQSLIPGVPNTSLIWLALGIAVFSIGFGGRR